jgi:hypothetical protein
MAAQAVSLHAAERDAASLRAQLVERDAACAQLGALLAAVHRQELRPEQLSEFAVALPAPAAPQPAPAAAPRAPTRSPFHGVPAEEVTWDAPLSSRPALERPPTVPPLSLGALRGGGGGHSESPPFAGVRAAARGSRGSDSASERIGHVPPRPGSRGQAR